MQAWGRLNGGDVEAVQDAVAGEVRGERRCGLYIDGTKRDPSPPHCNLTLDTFLCPSLFRPQGREASVRREGLLHERTGRALRAGKEEDGTARVRGQSASQV